VTPADQAANELRSHLRVLALPLGRVGRESGDVHRSIQARLCELGEDLGYLVWPEYPIEDLGYVDVVFKRARAPLTDPAVHAFEIDYNPKRKSIEKLLWFSPETTTWIVVFSSNPRPVTIRRVPRRIRIFVVPRA